MDLLNDIVHYQQDYRDIMNSFGLGKKPFFQRFAGVAGSYVGEKGADQAFDALLLILKEIFNKSYHLLIK